MLVDRFQEKVFEDTYNKFKDRGVTRKQIEDIHFNLWIAVHKILASGQFATIYLPKFGRLKPRLNALLKYCKKLRKSGSEEDLDKADYIEQQVKITYGNKRTRKG